MNISLASVKKARGHFNDRSITMQLRLMQIFAIVLFLMVPAQLWFIQFISIGVRKISFPEVILAALFIFILAKAFKLDVKATFRKKSIIHNEFCLPLLLFIVMNLLSCFFASNTYLAARALGALIPCIVLFFLVYAIHKDQADILSTIRLLFIWGFVFSLYAFYQYYLVGPQNTSVEVYGLEGSNVILSSDYSTHMLEGESIYGLTLPGLNPNIFGIISVILFLFGIYLMRADKPYRFFYGPAAALMLWNVTSTGSRGTYISLLFSLLYFLKAKWFSFRVLIMMLILVVGIHYFSMKGVEVTEHRFSKGIAAITDYFEGSGGKEEGSERVELMSLSLQTAWEKPFLGMGLGNSMTVGHSTDHNTYTLTLAECGVFGLFFLIWFLYKIFTIKKIDSKMVKSNKELTSYLLQLQGLTAVGVALLVSLNFCSYLHYFWICLALLAACAVAYKQKAH